MKRQDIDNLLEELGASDEDTAKPRPRAKETGLGKHRVDEAEESFCPLPASPAGQTRFGEESDDEFVDALESDPAVPVPPPPTPERSVGEAFQAIYQPEDEAVGEQEFSHTLLTRGIITPEQFTNASSVLKQTPGKRLVDILIEQGVDEVGIQTIIAELAHLPFERISIDDVDKSVDGKHLQRLGASYCKQHEVIPLREESNRVVLGVTQPDDVFLLDDVRRRLHVSSIKVVVVTCSDLLAVLEIMGEANAEDVDVDEILGDIDEDDVQVEQASSDEVDLEKLAGESPVIRYVNYILQSALKEGASDIHIEPGDKKLKVRFRIDGILFEMMNPPGAMTAAITSRLKIMGNLDISERRLPQDGRIRCVVRGRKLDLRMSTIPTPYGEKTVLRILDTRSINVALEDLGFDENTLRIWKGQIVEPNGIILVTGPTGSGKTTTLYSSLRQMDKGKLNVSTVEDPVEYHLDGITQTQTHEKIGMTFAKALKSLLRQDPDIVMIGEIRDMETAHTAVQAALTGHLVLSTLHTNDAPSSVTRLVNIGLEPFLVGAALNAVLAQRLVRRLCQNCKHQVEPNEEMCEFLEMNGLPSDLLWEGKGCDKCRNTGYQGRVGIYELLVVDDQMRDVIARNPNVSEFRKLCLERGMSSLRLDGFQKVRDGYTTVTEILRVTESGH